jgi:MscS family membrane protein
LSSAWRALAAVLLAACATAPLRGQPAATATPLPVATPVAAATAQPTPVVPILVDALPAPLRELELLGVALWQWIGVGVLVLVALALAWLAAELLERALRPLLARTRTTTDDRFLAAVTGPLRLLFTVLFAAAGLPLLALTPRGENFAQGLLTGLGVAAVAWVGLRVVDVSAEALHRRLEQEDNRAVTSVIPLGRRAAKVFLLLVAVVVLLQNVGVNVTGLIAGLGVGGIAVALAAQKTIENVFGGVSVISDGPVRVGDFCRFADGRVGTVEEIGLRSTRIRTLDRTLVTIPNADFAQRELENYAARDRMRLFAILGLRYETTPDQLRCLLETLRRLLREHPKVSPDPCRVAFVGFGASSLDLEVFAYVLTADFNEFVAIREEIYLRMMDAVQDAGTAFAFPSQTLYLGRDPGIDEERARRAEESVRAGRDGAGRGDRERS